MTADTIATSVGAVPVLHRLALGLVTKDVVTDRGTTGALRVGWEASGHLLPRGAADWWPCVDLERMGGGRFRLRATPRGPEVLTVRLFDPTRRYVGRRLQVPLWPYPALVDPSPANLVSVASRTLQAWLFPGAAYPVSSGMTVVRGRVTRQGEPLPWARVSATAGGATVGDAHADDRGEFLLLLTDTNQHPLQSSVTVNLVVRAAGAPAAVPDPPVEAVARPSNPPLPGDLDNPLLRGRTVPAGYVPNTAVLPPLVVKVGEEMVLPADVPFNP
ncbi:MAG: hypothetical protein QM695_16145 [Micropruina sp.]